jgi:phosphoenolpyruvate carboxykinase (ATP)
MSTQTEATGLDLHGLEPTKTVHWNLQPAELVEHALARGEGRLSAQGCIVVKTAPHTGRSPDDKFTVRDAHTADEVDWGDVNVPVDPQHYALLKADVVGYLNDRDLFVHEGRVGDDPDAGLNVRLVTERAWNALFGWNMFLRHERRALAEGIPPDFTVLHAPEFQAVPERHGCHSSAAVMVNFADRHVVIAGTRYGGEIKKSIFSVMNHLLPGRDILPMHCSANVGSAGDTALFFGLSGTGKTTLSADPERDLIGDDEHGWSDAGVFNFEGGCYAKMIRLSQEGEPEIYAATRRFGSILENVVLDERSREPDFDDNTITENTRGSYPIHYIPHARIPGRGTHPRTVVFLTADAYGVLPPISILSPAQAMYQFLSGYTAKVAGTERGITEPKATFSACFGAPFLPRHPGVYAEMLGRKIQEHGTRVFLVNTGWTGGPYGTGHRIALQYTRAMVHAALSGELDQVETTVDPVFGVSVPTRVTGVPAEVLQPRNTWADPEAYDAQAGKLAAMFRANFARYADGVSTAVREAGPQV